MASHTFSWEGDGVDVTLLGSFDSWKSPGRTMDRVENGFAVTISLTPGRYEYKFIVDGEYRYDPHKKVVPDGQGGLNNVYETTETPSGNTINVKMASHDNQQSSDSLTQEQPLATTTANKASYTVKITRIAKIVTEATLTKLVEKHGTLVSKVAIKGTTNRYAWVNFDSLEGAKKAVENLNGYCQEGLKLNASLKQSSNVPAVKPLPRQAPASKVSPIKHNTKNAEFTQKLPYQLDLIRSKDNKDTESIGCDDPISEVNVQLQCLSVDDLVLRINYELKNTKAATRERIMQLEWELNEITTPKRCPLELFQTLQARRTSIEHEIDESESRQIVFSTFCEKLLAMATTGPPLSVLQLERSFICECSRYHKGLPIYSHRLQIMKMIKENQVSILTAETGSGKSTQLVQYISEDGFADTGIIICTQPRKVAAMSLAKYVSSEMLAVPGSIVGYKTGIRGNYSDQTKVLYVTDHTLLNECVEDPNFSKYSCLIVDEAHERNLNTDVLLAFIKRCLPKRPELRVVITSATIDPESFIRYFGLDCPVKKVPGRTFPVDVTYCPIEDNPSVPNRRFMPEYVTGAIKLASTLHSNEPPGDILVFLTSPAETEQACQSLEMLTNDTAHVLPLHGKLQPDDQQKVFREYSLRKIVFSTNIAETSVTIPGVKYIVDSGLAKELCFDAKKNMNSLEVRPISKSSAEQRKGRAGRTSAGKCYRLYSEDTYKNMAERTVPEILRVSLAGTVLKLHELGIRDVLNFDFIEKPEEAALKYAVKTLTFLGAVIDGRLTNMGKSMAALPVDPRLSRIILDGLNERAGPEAIAMAAISSLAGTIFFRGGTDEMKERSDLLKSTFCVPEGDQLTDLNAYCQWVNQSPQDRTAWCVEKSINAKSMRIVHESVRDLTEILTKQLKLPIHSTSLSLEVASERVTRLFFKAFANNLCAFLGHKNIGYFNPNLPDEKLVIFPGSALNKLNSQPQLLVYEKTLKTSQHFLLQTLPVKEEWVKEALKSRVIPFHPMACEQYKKLAVTSFSIGNLGEYVLNILKRNQRMIIDQMSTNMLKKIEFVHDIQHKQGIVQVFANESYCESLQVYLEQYINSLREEMKKLCHETGVTAEGDNVRVLIGSGGSTTRLLMPHQYRSLFARGPLAGSWHEELASNLSECGAILKQETKPFPKERHLWVTFHDPEDAEKANKLDCPVGVTLQPQLPKKEDGLNTPSLSIKLEWNRRERKNFINIDFRTPLCVPSVISQLHGNVEIAGNLLRFRPSKYNHCHVYITNVHPQIPEEAIRNEFHGILTPLGYLRGSYDIIFAYTQKFETSEQEYEELQAKLKSLLTPSVPKDRYNLQLLRREPKNIFYVAYVNFLNIDEGMIALDSLNNARIDYKPIRVTRSLSSSIKYSTTLYAAIEKSLEEASKSVKAKYQSVKVTIKLNKGFKVLKVESNTPAEYVGALKEFNSVLKPEIIDCSSQLYYEYMRSKKCEEDISRIETTTLTVIKRDFRLKSIKLYGTKENTQQARTEFDKLLSFGNESIKYREVSLKQNERPPGLLKYLITTFGIDLSLLITQPGIKMVRIDLRNHQLIVFASDAGYQVLIAIIEQFCRENATKPQTDPAHTAEVECCACYTPIDKTDSVYRLEYCGHAYHYECIETQLSPNTITIPILCAADNCSEPFVWQDFENLKTKGILDPRDVITESVRAYLATNQECVHNCPTPDCDMVYAVTEERSCFLCSHCGVLTCTKCHKVYHSGLTCEQNESAGCADEDLQKWLKEDTVNRKLCPKCSIGIEKFEGCAHVHCMQCKSHICWHCMAFFGSSGECYGHLSSTHGGFV